MLRSTQSTRRTLLSSLALLAAGGALGRATARAGGALRAAFLYIGTIDADLWSYAHDQGRREMERRTGIATAFTQSVTAAEAEGVLRAYAQQGYSVIFSTSFDFAGATLSVARDFPNVVFEQATGVQSAPNLGTYNGRIYQAWYLAGMAAGAVTQTGQVGYLAPFAIPEVIRHLNAFTLGARSVNPRVSVRPRWTSTWFDPPTERAATEALAAGGADVIATESDSDTPNRVAAALGLSSTGYNAVPPEPPAGLLTAPVWRWSVFYERVIGDIVAGRWTNAPDWWGMESGLVDLAPVSAAVPATIRERIDAVRRQIVAGSFEVFAGPLTDNSGGLRIPAGRTMTDTELLAVDWLVEGVVGALPTDG